MNNTADHIKKSNTLVSASSRRDTPFQQSPTALFQTRNFIASSLSFRWFLAGLPSHDAITETDFEYKIPGYLSEALELGNRRVMEGEIRSMICREWNSWSAEEQDRVLVGFVEPGRAGEGTGAGKGKGAGQWDDDDDEDGSLQDVTTKQEERKMEGAVKQEEISEDDYSVENFVDTDDRDSESGGNGSGSGGDDSGKAGNTKRAPTAQIRRPEHRDLLMRKSHIKKETKQDSKGKRASSRNPNSTEAAIAAQEQKVLELQAKLEKLEFTLD